MERARKKSAFFLILGGLLGASAIGCGDDSDGGSSTAILVLEPEDVILDGLAAGDGDEDITDGWEASFERYIVTIGAVDATLDVATVSDSNVFVADLAASSAAGFDLWALSGLSTGRWNISYATPIANAAAMRDDSVSQDDFDAMVAGGWTYLVEGEITRADGQSCPPAALATPGDATPNGNTSGTNDCYDNTSVRYTLGVPAAIRYADCTVDEDIGFAVSEGANNAAFTIHGDHLFFNGFPEEDEGGVTRLAQWFADCDLNLDGEVSQAELAMISPSDLPEIDERFQIGGGPIEPIDDMFTYIRAQLMTTGHFQGEGECPPVPL